MNELHLFAGAGGGILGGMLLGHTCVCAVEIEPYCRKVLLQRQRDGILPKFPIWDDVRTFDGRPWRGVADVVCGGFPCRGYSTATAGKHTAEDFWPEMGRVVADVAPRYVFAENTARRAIEAAAEQLHSMGYIVKATPLCAADVGADHIRKRYWLLAHTDLRSELLRPLNAEVARVPSVPPCIWKTYPDKSRMADGLADRLDRLKAIGNGQVPAVVKLAWETLSL